MILGMIIQATDPIVNAVTGNSPDAILIGLLGGVSSFIIAFLWALLSGKMLPKSTVDTLLQGKDQIINQQAALIEDLVPTTAKILVAVEKAAQNKAEGSTHA